MAADGAGGNYTADGGGKSSGRGSSWARGFDLIARHNDKLFHSELITGDRHGPNLFAGLSRSEREIALKRCTRR